MSEQTIRIRTIPSHHPTHPRRLSSAGRRRLPLQRNARRQRRRSPESVANTQRHLAIAITILAASMALGTLLFPAASTMFDKLFPTLMLVLGYYFAQR